MEKPVIYKDKNEAPSDAKSIDAFDGAMKELFFVENPAYKNKKGTPEAEEALKNFLDRQIHQPVYVYYPDEKLIISIPPEEIYFKLRTARNRDIITEEEQNDYRNINAGIAGLSVGSAVLAALVVSGGPKNIKIADFDTLEFTNLNRIKARLTDMGANKTHIAAREVWSLDPFANLELWEEGIKLDTLEKFILDSRLDVFIDEMDSIPLKIAARLVCQKNKIPVVMATDNGNGLILDVERFDLEEGREIFHGLLDPEDSKDLENISFQRWLKLATKIVGPEYLTEEMQNSLLAIGKTVTAVPQLGTSASMAGAAVAYAVRKIASKEKLDSGRYIISLEEKLVPGYLDAESINLRRIKTDKFKENFGK